MPLHFTISSIRITMIIIGIDPDTDKNGVSIWEKNNATLELRSLDFFQLQDYLREQKAQIKIVKIEAGWLNKISNFRKSKSKAISDSIARKVGENHQAGKNIEKLCQNLQIEYRLVKPFKKNWGTKSGKISHIQMMTHLARLKIKLINISTNQDNRDSALIALYG